MSAKKNYSGSKSTKINSKTNDKIIWKSVVGFSKYDVSNTGLVRECYSGRILKPYVNSGYNNVNLCAGEHKKQYRVHRLVARAFIPNPLKLPVVDHIDNNKLNNNVDNLRWCTYAQNTQFFVDNHREKSKAGKSKQILQYDLDGNLVKRWKSIAELKKAHPKYCKGYIYHNIVGKSKSAYGYKWKYRKEDYTAEEKPKIAKSDRLFKPIGIIGNFDFNAYKISKKGNIINSKMEYLSPQKNLNGYMTVGLECANNKRRYKLLVHCLVAHVYVPNDKPNVKIQVNHIDKNRSNNYYKNLEWCTAQANTAHSLGKMVKMIDRYTNEVIKIFRTVKDADRYIGVRTNGIIGKVCDGKCDNRGFKIKTYYGYKWEWVKDGEEINLPIIIVPINPSGKEKRIEILNINEYEIDDDSNHIELTDIVIKKKVRKNELVEV
ncbi:putative HNH endonuclease [Tupanvirus deep ocean]|uniref:HNH endonuclease n=2 Tax=Tupanvirus TaxID=2094720 RepID=A0AC62A6Z1_9VIRU|nr:putative HNH endonuclease [Tupanvirus deep ocean]QKU33542.1 putative HNH endonuclease [Tupanvirus deep ocean]